MVKGPLQAGLNLAAFFRHVSTGADASGKW